MNEYERPDGLSSPLRVEALEDRNAPTSFGSWSFGGWWSHLPAASSHSHHGTPPKEFARGHFGHHHHHHKPHSPPASPPPAQTGTVSGVLYQDLNKDGVFDAGDAVAGGVVVWADLNGNGVVDAGEPSTTTAANGSYTLTGLPTGVNVSITTTGQVGFVSSPVSVSVQPGQTVTGVNLGLTPVPPA